LERRQGHVHGHVFALAPLGHCAGLAAVHDGLADGVRAGHPRDQPRFGANGTRAHFVISRPSPAVSFWVARSEFMMLLVQAEVLVAIKQELPPVRRR
jgi:hypothetical protein